MATMVLPEGAVIRDGVLCCCGPTHGYWPKCVGSESPLAEALGLIGPAAKAKRTPSKRLPVRKRQRTSFSLTDETVKSRRRRITITKQDVADCQDCTTIHEASRYCDHHRELAVQNVLRAVGRDVDAMRCGSLLLMVAERYGIDLTD